MRRTGCKMPWRVSVWEASGCADEDVVYREEIHYGREDVCLCRR